MAVSESWYSRAACACDLPASTSRMTLSLNSRVNIRRFVADFSDMLSLLPQKGCMLNYLCESRVQFSFLTLSQLLKDRQLRVGKGGLPPQKFRFAQPNRNFNNP